MEINEITGKIIEAAMEVHSTLGAGLLESAYEECLCHELHNAGLNFERQKGVPIAYKKIKLDCGFRLDLLVAENVIVEIKAVDKILPIHQVQLLTYLKLTGLKVGLIINFNTISMKNGIKRVVNGFMDPGPIDEKRVKAERRSE